MKIRNRREATHRAAWIIRLILSLFACFASEQTAKAQVSPIQGLGQVQFFDNSGVPLTNGVLYSYQAGTTTQQATYTDSTGTVQNVNPIAFTTGARAQIWLTTSAFYKFVLCLQNDGPFCAANDILFSVDNVPGGSSGGGGGGGSPFTGIFISSTASPATSGILRLASGDSICWRNAAGSTNLCFKKDSNDLLSWDGGSLKLPEVGAPAGVAGFDILWADNTAHRLKAVNNGGTAAQYVLSGVDVNTSDQVNQLHFGATGTPLSGTAPTTGQFLQWNGTNVVGANLAVYSTASASGTSNLSSTTMATAGSSGNKYVFTATAYVTAAGTSCTGNTTVALSVAFTDNVTNNAFTLNLVGVNDPGLVGGTGGMGLAPTLGLNNSAVGQTISWYPLTINAKASTTVSYSATYTLGTNCSPGPAFYLMPQLTQIQ